MTFSLLRIVLWIGLYIVVTEIGLEIRAHYRGFDTLLLGNFQQTEPGTAAAAGRLQSDTTDTGSDLKQTDATSGSVRYWIASSSHAEDSYLSREVIFPSVLERLLRAGGIQATVINASHAGMEIDDNTSDVESRAPQVKPDYVILYQMSSTITSLSKQLLSGASERMPRPNMDKGDSVTTWKPLNWTVWLVEQTAIYAQLKGHLTSRLATKRVLADSLGSAGDARFEEKIRAFIAATRGAGAIPILCTFATSHVRRDLPNFPDSAVTLIFKYNIYLSLAGWVETIERFNNILRHIAAEEGLVLIDVENTVAGHEDYFRDFVHFTPRGHSAVATAIRDALIANSQDIKRQHVVMN
jgi:hypothetical protein